LQLKTFVEIAGWSGAALILGAYGLVSAGKLQPRSALYQWMNLVGALGFIINSGWNGAWPSVGLNVVWLGIALLAMTRHSRRAPPPVTRE
jgi:uncharacterized membrane protein